MNNYGIFRLSLICYAKRSKIGEHGNEGGSLDIKCSYPDGYQYKPKYLCRHPCSYSDILIRSVKADTFVTVGRFSVYDNVHGHTFIATIKNLKLQDSGLYYCGLDQWGRDVLTKVDVSVSKGTHIVLFLSHLIVFECTKIILGLPSTVSTHSSNGHFTLLLYIFFFILINVPFIFCMLLLCHFNGAMQKVTCCRLGCRTNILIDSD
uniref:Immunoglobulin V-set domain-containing protein n=1 Tax=Oncorhynchus tshawytscha TaxID=74940 RepID=A0A8C8GZR7_ONCTS